jgi:cell division septum initiation protein DivIVA
MTKDPVFNAEDHREHDTHKLLTPELRQDIVRLKEQMEEYAAHLDNLCHNLESINDAVLRAQEFAESLLTDDISGAWEVISNSQQINECDVNVEDDWEMEPLD